MFKHKYLIILLTIIWSVTLFLMIQNYIQYPPLEESDPLYDRKNNIEGSAYKYGILSFIELVFGIVSISYFFTLPVFIRFVTVVLSVGLVVWGFVDAMYSGGVASAHALWLTLEMVMVFSFIIFQAIRGSKVVK